MKTIYAHSLLLLLLLFAGCRSARVSQTCCGSFPAIPKDDSPAGQDTWYRGRMPFIPITHPFFDEAYGDLRPTLDAILGDGRRDLLREPDSIRLYPARHMMPEDEAELDALTLLGFSVAVGDGVPLDRQDVHDLVAQMQRPGSFGDNFLGVTSADFGLKFTKGTNSLDVIFELVVPSVTLATRHTRHDDRRAASPDLMAAACKLAEAYLFEDQNLQRKIEIFRSSNQEIHGTQ